jgi:acetyl esterase/lipase
MRNFGGCHWFPHVMKAIPSCLALFLYLAPSLLHAKAPASPFDRWDTNGDGKLSREELPEPIRRNFERADANGDGFLSREEDAAIRRNRPPGAGGQGAARLPEGVKKISTLDYAGTGNPRQKLDLYLPEKREEKALLPVIVFIHGGGWQNGDKNGGGGKVAPFVASGKFAGASNGYRLSGEAQWPA